ncbi:MAG: YcxB family protein [Bacteroidales bacterium]|nr:YcxB family protein [Bacteroidales bacterium]
MNPLYTIKSLYSREEFMRFGRSVRLRNKTFIIILVALNVVLLACLVFALIKNAPFWAVVAGLYLVFMDWYLLRGTDKRMAKTFMQNKDLADKVLEFRFYDDHFDVFVQGRFANVSYDKIQRVVETKTNIYIMYSNNQGAMLQKSNVPDGFSEFLTRVTSK